MMMPEDIRTKLKERLWAKADELGWSNLSDAERAKHYEMWTRDSEIGGILGHFMDPRKVRVYIKDSLLKPYERARLSRTQQVAFERLGIKSTDQSAETYIKPHGQRLLDGRIICWGKSRDWKLILMAVYERSHLEPSSSPFAAILLETGKSSDLSTRAMIVEAGHRLGISKIVWID
jgi:hypothetical protein